MSNQTLSRERYEALIRTETRPHATLHRAIREVLLAHDAALRAKNRRLRVLLRDAMLVGQGHNHWDPRSGNNCGLCCERREANARIRHEIDSLSTREAEDGRLHKQLYAASRLLSKVRDIMSYDSVDPTLQNAIDIWLVDYTPEKHIQREAEDE